VDDNGRLWKVRGETGAGTTPSPAPQLQDLGLPAREGMMTDSHTLVVYEKPTCTTCRKLVKLLKEKGVEFERLNYFIDPLPRKKLEELLGKMALGPRDLLRKREARYKELGLKDPGLSDEAILNALVRYPELVERPIIEKGDRAVLGRPVEKVLELL
jgi:arsenate reductase